MADRKKKRTDRRNPRPHQKKKNKQTKVTADAELNENKKNNFKYYFHYEKIRNKLEVYKIRDKTDFIRQKPQNSHSLS